VIHIESVIIEALTQFSPGNPQVIKKDMFFALETYSQALDFPPPGL
jgi:hypothetical protein